MRTFAIALFALALPFTSASAASIPVQITLHNTLSADCTVVIGDAAYTLPHFASRPLYVPVGSDVQIYSAQNSRLHGQTLLNVTAADADHTVTVQ